MVAYGYYGLIVIAVVLLGVSLIYKKSWRPLLLHICVAGIIHPFEVVVFLLLDAYRYFPGITADPKLDNYLGSYISNSLIVPASAVVINVFSLPWDYALGIATAFTVVDWYFSIIGIYLHFWWRSGYTGIGLCLLYAISKWVWSGLQSRRPACIFRLTVIYLIYAPLHNLLVFLANRGGILFRFESARFADPEKFHQGFFYLYLFLTSVVITLCIGLKWRWRYRVAALALLFLVYWTLGKCHIFVPHMSQVAAWQLILVPVIVVPLVMCLFRLARLDYLFPR